MLVVEGAAVYQQSDAFFQVVRKLDSPWKIAYVFRMIPKSLRNWLYERIALNQPLQFIWQV